MVRRSLGFIVLGLLGLLISPSRAQACSCMAGIPVCESVWKSDAVFSGEVLSVEPINPTGDSLMRYRRVLLRVIDSWRGSVSGTVEVMTGAGGGDCGYGFISGMTYLVYAHASNGGLRTSICSRTRPLSQAGADVAYLKTAMKPAGVGRVFGKVEYQRQWDPNGGRTPEQPIAGYPVMLSDGKQTWKAVTDSSGRYEFSVPAGTYTVTLTTPDTERGHGPRNVTLADPRGCAAADFYVVPDGRIRVRVLDAAGAPIPNFTVEIIDEETIRGDRPFSIVRPAETDAEGYVEFQELHPKRYALAVNAMRPPSRRAPFATTFYPGVTALKDARSIELGSGERLELGDWRLPPPLATRQIQGTIVLEDGKPAPRARLIVTTPRKSQWGPRAVDGANVLTDEEGRFAVTLHEGIDYEFMAFLNVGETQWSSVRVALAAEDDSKTPIRIRLQPTSRR